MDFLKNINLSDFTYNLPEERIAKFPLQERDKSNLIIYEHENILLDKFESIEKYLPENSLLIYNNTKVIHARLIFQKPSGANIEVFCLEPAYPSDYQLAFAETETCVWHCLVGNKKKWKSGDLFKTFSVNGKNIELRAKIESDNDQGVLVRFSWNNTISFSEVLLSEGNIPLPPYIKRQAEESDKIRYQTVFSQFDGSVAAPTAGLHFTDDILKSLDVNKNIKTQAITLHVGAGTFKPISSDRVVEHQMHREHFQIDLPTIQLLKQFYGNITITGTTSLRAVESLYWLAQNLYRGENSFDVAQWDAYKQPPALSITDSLDFLLDFSKKNKLSAINATTSLMIVPGYEFKFANNLITNFHQPNSTLLLLIAAFIGDDWKKVYSIAFENNFRFLSYGDSSLLMR